jgi:altronate hydrolase
MKGEKMCQTKPLTIRLNAADNVVVAIDETKAGNRIPGEDIVCRDPIPAGHKLAIADIDHNAPVLKYNQIIGFASRPIAQGEHVHTHNLEIRAFSRDHAIGLDRRPTDYVTAHKRATLHGIPRADGRVGTRNYIGVLPTVNCSATVARYIADAFRGDALSDFPNVDGVVALCHGTGCGMAGSGEGFEILQRTIGGYARHPNFASVLLVGLGCEVNEIESLLESMHLETGPLLQTMTIQQQGGTKKTVHEGVTRIRDMLHEANRVERSTVPLSRLVLGLECGGSDAYSGITANPALGAAVDILVRHGGTAVLSETPEIYGAEHLLTRRAVNEAVGERLVQRIRWWEEYTVRNGGEMDNNPSPGNKAGGLTTILEKSLGAVAKGGTTNLMDVYRYAEPVTSSGLVFMDTPGYDSVSVTGMVAGGVNMVCFTTGRGSVFGCKPVPSLKLATNTAMYSRMTDDMDVNCGIILDGEVTIEEMGERIFHLILETASGKKTKSELLGFGDNEFTPWQIGSVM